ncbi:MAG TPA: PIN/TRAM domain-containing protein [Planctomycetaceae bacterium]|nr:PIN/TRAM domain-containing protein [Planctomycetaceae bacterium]
MALAILRILFLVVSAGIAVAIFTSATMRDADASVPWWVIGGMICLPLIVIASDAAVRRKNLATITAIYFGLLIGVILDFVAMLALEPVLPLQASHPVRQWLPVVLGAVLCYLSTSLLLQTRDDFRFLIPFVEFARDVRGMRPIVLDAASVVDGRIVDLAEAGVFDSRFVLPSFVLDSLQAWADSDDQQLRVRGRRGLDMLARMRANPALPIDVVEPGAEEAGGSLESRVLALAVRLGGRLVTTDPNLARTAGVRKIAVVNLNEVALSLRPNYLPGDPLTVRVVRPGEEPDQGVGYLDDGTMIVVENGRDRIGRSVAVTITRQLQTAGGRLVFARPDAGRG